MFLASITIFRGALTTMIHSTLMVSISFILAFIQDQRKQQGVNEAASKHYRIESIHLRSFKLVGSKFHSSMLVTPLYIYTVHEISKNGTSRRKYRTKASYICELASKCMPEAILPEGCDILRIL